MGMQASGDKPLHDVRGALLVALGFCLLLTCDWLNELTAFSTALRSSGASGRVVGWLVVATFVAAAVFGRRIRPWLARHAVPLVMALGAASLVGRAAFAVCSLTGVGAVLPFMIAQVVYSLAETALLLCWFVVLCGEVSRDVPVIVPLAYVGAAACALIGRVVPPTAVTVVASLLPMASAAVLGHIAAHGVAEDPRPFAIPGAEGVSGGPDEVGPAEKIGVRAAGCAPTDARAGAARARSARIDAAESTAVPGASATLAATAASAFSAANQSLPDAEPARRWSFPVRPVVLMVAFAFVFRFSLALSHGPNPYGVFGMLAISLVALAVALLARRGAYSPAFLYKIALPLMVAGLIALAFLDAGRVVAVMFTNSANISIALFMLVALCPMCHRYAIEPLWMFGIVQACSRAASLVGQPAGASLVDAFPVGTEANGVAVCIAIAALVTLAVFFFNDRLADASFGLAPTSADDGQLAGPEGAMTYNERVVWRCSQVARAHGLTQREQEVLELMAQGMTANDIAEKTCVSYGTVKTHVNHIYKKLDVHSRDEAVGMVGL